MGAARGEHVVKPAIDAFNKAANGEMAIEPYYADQLAPTSELFRAQRTENELNPLLAGWSRGRRMAVAAGVLTTFDAAGNQNQRTLTLTRS